MEQSARSGRHRPRSRHVLAGEIEDAPDIGFFLRRHAENPEEDSEFLFGDDAIGLGHLAGQRDHRDGEDYAGIVSRSKRKWPAAAPSNAPSGPPTKQARRRATDFTPD